MFWLLISIVIGILLGLSVGEGGMGVVVFVKQVSGQFIFFLVPLVILAFISSSIASLKDKASRMILFTFVLAYVTTEIAAMLSLLVGQTVIPMLDIQKAVTFRAIPSNIFMLEIPPVMNVMTALVLAIFLGLGTTWVKSEGFVRMLATFKEIVLLLIKRVLIPILPFYIAANFCELTYQGALPQMKVFFMVLIIAIAGHYIWLALLYFVASVYSGKNGWKVVKHYGRAYVTALGTMSSAASLGVALECAKKSNELDEDVVDFCIPIFNNIHLSGSVFTEVLLVCAVSLVMYGALPSVGSMILFVLLLGIFAVGAPGVPGGTVMASLGLIIAVVMVPDASGQLHNFTDAGTSMLITLFALQDSFGTACNLTGDGALTMIVNKRANKE